MLTNAGHLINIEIGDCSGGATEEQHELSANLNHVQLEPIPIGLFYRGRS